MRFLTIGLPLVAMHGGNRILVRDASGRWQHRGEYGRLEARSGNLTNPAITA